MVISSKPAKRVALAALVLSMVFFLVTLLIGRWSGFFAISAMSWLILSAAWIWFVLSIQFHQRGLAEQEKLDMSQLVKSESSTTIFQATGERGTLFAVAQKRLALLEKWFLPVFSGILAIYQIAIGLYLLKGISEALEADTKQPLICAICMTAIAFISFVVSRYSTGMAQEQQWKPLRAGGSMFLCVAILSFVLAVGLALAQFKMFVVVKSVSFIIPVLLVILGAETALNILLEIYRPRIKGQYSRSAFDSGLLGVINEPSKIFRTVAGAIDYQFGFQVSQTWFYKLLEKAIVPLVLFAAVTLYFLSCIAVVNPNEQAVIEHFGNPVNEANDVRIVGPGLVFKRPWPIDIVYKYPTKQVMEINIGFVPKTDEKTGEETHEPLLWGQAHYKEEYNLLVASEQVADRSGGGGVPVSLVVAAVPVQYRIKDLYSYLYNHNEPQRVLEFICYRELTRFAASAKIDVDNEDDANHSLLGAGRAEAKEILTKRIQAAADEAGLGVEILFLGLQGIHPPVEVAADYQKVVGAVQKKYAAILNAQGQRNMTLSMLAGSIQDADELYNLALKYQQAKQEKNTEQMESLERQLDAAFANAEGDIFKTLRQAQSESFEKISLARASGERFADQLKAYNAAKGIYKRQQRLAVLEDALGKIRKYVVVADQNDAEVFIVDMKEKLTPSLYEISGLQENSEK